MKFSLKLVGFTTMIIAILFSIGGFVFVSQNFSYSLDTISKQNVAQHTIERYAIESNIMNLFLNSEDITDEKLIKMGNELTRYLSENKKYLGLYNDRKNMIFSNMPAFISQDNISESMNNNSNEYIIRETPLQTYMMITSFISIENHSVYVVSAYDITKVFDERSRQMQSFFILDGMIILSSVIAIFIFSLFLTAPIKRLNIVSKKIADGAYSHRAVIKSSDEIGELSHSFNAMAEAVEEKITELGGALQSRDDFMSSFSHEIKTPMTAIVGYSDMLRSQECDKATGLLAASYIFSESKRLEELSHKLMDLMVLSQESIDLKPVDVQRLVRKLSETVKPFLEQNKLERDIEKATVLADEALLHCLLQNLLLNAKKSNPRDGTIRITGKNTRDGYQFSVLDTGCGIPEEEIHRITEAFYMVDQSRSKQNGGTGLGLAISQKIAIGHGTVLHFESQVDVGTTVWFLLEVNDDDQQI